MEKYEVIYGNRRFEACSKLSLKSIEAKIHGREGTKRVLLSEIKQRANSRSKVRGSNLAGLMASIRDQGLLEPIGLTKIGELEEREFWLLNATENIHREDISAIELGKISCELMGKENMSVAEIAVKLNLPLTKLKTAVALFSKLPEKFHSLIGSSSNKTVKSGKLSPSIAHFILHRHLSKAKTIKFLEFARKNDLSMNGARKIVILMNQGQPFDSAISKVGNYGGYKLDILLHKETLDKMLKANKFKNRTELLSAILCGKVKGNKNLLCA